MPNRILRDGILTSDRVNELDLFQENVYRRLMSVVDDFGRFDGRHEIIRAAIFPLRLDSVTNDMIEQALEACRTLGLIVRYRIDGKNFLQMSDFRQQVRVMRSKCPEPTQQAIDEWKQVQGGCAADAQQMRSRCISSAHSGARESNSNETIRNESRAGAISDDDEHVRDMCTPCTEDVPPAKDPPAPVGVDPDAFPVQKGFWVLPDELYNQLDRAYPGIDLDGEIASARMWCVTNPGKRKTAKGMPRFLNAWMSRAAVKAKDNPWHATGCLSPDEANVCPTDEEIMEIWKQNGIKPIELSDLSEISKYVPASLGPARAGLT